MENLTVEQVDLFAKRYNSVKRLFGVNADNAIKELEQEVNIKLDNVKLFFKAMIMHDSDA